MKYPISDTAIQLFATPGAITVEYMRYFNNDRPLVRFLLDSDTACQGLFYHIKIADSILVYLTQPESKVSFSPYITKMEAQRPAVFLNDLYAKRIKEAVSAYFAGEGTQRLPALLFICGKNGCGKLYRLLKALYEDGLNALIVDMAALLEDGLPMEEKLTKILVEHILDGSVLIFKNVDKLAEGQSTEKLALFYYLLEKNNDFTGKMVVLLSEKKLGVYKGKQYSAVNIEIGKTEEESRLKFWECYSKDINYAENVDLMEIASKFQFTPAQIVQSISQARQMAALYKMDQIDSALLHQCCYMQAVMKLHEMAVKVNPAYTWTDLILPEEQISLLKETCAHMQYKHQVFNIWGFGSLISYGKGLSLLFSGPPGTGKTMAAQVVAHHLNMELYKIQLSQIVSKYVGETEKNLSRIFNEAQQANCILFFDETDALFGKRSDVKDAHDRHANIEVAYLLQQMEEYEGVIIMATNLLQNIDEAFMRRISFVIHFPFPDAGIREKIWRRFLNTNMPVEDDIDLEYLSKQFDIAGGSIKNIVLHAAFKAASEGAPLSMRHLMQSAVYEMRKSNHIIVKEDLKQYADLVFNE